MQLTFQGNRKALAAADHVLVIAPRTCFGPRARGTAAITQWLPPPLATLARELGAEASPGLLAGLATSRTASGKRLSVGVLADAFSRHASPARAEAIRRVVVNSGLASGGRHAVLVVLDAADHVLAAANAIGRALPLFHRRSAPPPKGQVAVRCTLADGSAVELDAEGNAVVAATRDAAFLVDTPPTELDPAVFATLAKRALRGRGVTIRELVGPALLRAKLHGIHAVGRCARSAPRLLVAQTGPRRGPHIALVGKGVTYDTGGLHLKARGAMESMKSDMGGAAAMLGAFSVLARHAPPCRLSLVLCLAENAIGPSAFKPDDILTLHSGKTVEINNTDAEGRLLLADGCSWAARELAADIVLDAATLTGAQGVATGELHAAVVADDERIERTLLDAGRATGDLCWPLPFAPEFHRSEFASPVADMRNSVKNRSNAQSSCAAEFVHWHLDGTAAKWGHVDLAFPAYRADRGTGFGVALFVAAVRALARAGTTVSRSATPARAPASRRARRRSRR